ncbi:glutaredoxin-C9-like [Typha latifolia]|uniref:glutaredoxin-C9-like n=1 Tax=Typha latifolia TaxID=4733 RepID=UPI003C2CA78B
MRVVEEEEEEEAEVEVELMVMRGAYEKVARMASGNAVVVFSLSGCCMCHVVKRLLIGLGVGPTVYELDQMERSGGGGREIQAVLAQLLVSTSAGPAVGPASTSAVPAVFVGGKLLGGVEKVMACHINGSLVPLLKQAGALWL